jgi:hypothetical protein
VELDLKKGHNTAHNTVGQLIGSAVNEDDGAAVYHGPMDVQTNVPHAVNALQPWYDRTG